MTIKDIFSSDSGTQSMAKRQKTAADDSKPISDEMLGALSLAMDSKADINIVEFSYDISDTDITPGEPISDSELPPRIKKDKKKKKKHNKEKKSKTSNTSSSDTTHSQNKDNHEQSDAHSSNALSKS